MNLENCGTQNENNIANNNNYNQVPKKSKKKWIIITIIVLLLIIIVPLIINALATNYSIANLKFYVNPDWKREGEKNLWYNDSNTCALQMLADEMTDSVYKTMKNKLENNYSTTLKEKKVNNHTWEYSNAIYQKYKINIYSTIKDGYGYFILYSYDENDDECTKYLERFEKTIKFKN